MKVSGYNGCSFLTSVFSVCLLLFVGQVDGNEYCNNKYDNKCVCTDDYVECHGAHFRPNITAIYHDIKDNVRIISITGSHLKELPKNVFGSCRHDSTNRLDSLKSVDLSNNSIEYIHGKTFHCMRILEELNLSHNKWKNDLHTRQIGYFTSLPSLKRLDLTNAFDEVWNGSVHMTKLATIFNETDMRQLKTLKLGQNEFFSFSLDVANTMCSLESLETLDLSHNNLESPSLPTKENCLEKLTTLDLSHNKMKRLPNEFIKRVSNLKDLKSIKLDGNLFDCDCGLIDTWYWLNSTSLVSDKAAIKCEDGFHSSYIGKHVLTIKPEELMCMTLEAPSSKAAQVVVGIIFAVIGVTIVAFLIVNRDKVKLVYKRWSKRLPRLNLRSRTGYKSVQEVAFVENV